MDQLYKRLERKGYTRDEIAEVINKLIEWKYLDDRNYAISYCKNKLDKYSGARIKMELLKVGIDKQITDSILDDLYLRDKEYTNCLDLAQKLFIIESQKWEKKHDNNIKESKYPFEIYIKKKLGDKLLQKGYPFDIVKNILAEILS